MRDMTIKLRNGFTLTEILIRKTTGHSMYDLINNWEELEQLKSKCWKIDRRFDRELNEFEFTLTLSTEEDEIFRIYVRFGCRLEKGNIGVYVDTFNAWSAQDVNEGINTLQIIYRKCTEFEKWCKDNDYVCSIGRT